MPQYLRAAMKLHDYLLAWHWHGSGLLGPDPGIRFNYRIGRFIKSYLQGIVWSDDYHYMQAQGYWVLANWHLYVNLAQKTYAEVAVYCSRFMLNQQREDGAWDYPNPEWRGRITTYEGIWGSLGLLETYRQTAQKEFLNGALRWYKFLLDTIGFQHIADELAINYFANRPGPRVPNNSSDTLRFLAELAETTGDNAYLAPCPGLLAFLQAAQKKTGEFPYAVAGVATDKCRPHFQCYQYNAFQCLNLIRYHDITGDSVALPLIKGVLSFLRGGLAQDGHAFYDCHNRHREVAYHTAVLAAAFAKADHLGIDGYADLANRAYSFLLGLQGPDGGFWYSRRDYHLLSDRRSYPRYLAMILYHLLLADANSQMTIARIQRRLDDLR